MKKTLEFVKNRLLIILFLLFYFGFCFLTYKNYGITPDEFFVYTRGKYFYTKVKGNDQQLQKGFAIKDRGNENLLYYNSTYPAFLYLFNSGESYERYHLLNMIFSSIIFFVFYEVILYLYKKPQLAIVGPVFLFFTPRLLGHIPINPKDMPFAILYFLSLAAIFFLRLKSQIIRVLFIGILIGLSISLRVVGFTLFFIYGYFMLTELLFSQKKTIFVAVKEITLEMIVMFMIGYFIFLISMPYVAADPFNHLIELMRIDKDYPWYGKILFFGRYLTTEQRPFSYLLVWTIITTPIFLLMFSICSLFVRMFKERATWKNLLIVSIVFQLVLYGLIHPTIYNGMRHYLFLIPQLTMLATICFIEILQKKTIAILAIIFVLINIGFVVKSYIELHPYEYTYFNTLIGGTQGAYGKFRNDYWETSEKEALLWLKEYLDSHHLPKVNIYVCSKSNSLAYYLPEENDVNIYPEKTDYAICDNKREVINLYSKNKLDLLYIVSRQNVPLQFIYQVSK